MKSEIKLVGGKPRLYVDGKYTPAMAYTTYFGERGCYQDFINAGYRIFFVNLSFTSLPINSIYTGFTPFRKGAFENNLSPDFSEFEDEVYKIIRLAPDAIIIPRLYVSMPTWWRDTHQDETVETRYGGRREALFSDVYRHDGCELIKRAVRHILSSSYKDRIGGWQLCGGQTQEWFHQDNRGSLGKAAERQYPIWVKEKYGEAGAVIPSPDDYDYSLHDKQESENAKRYSLFSNEEVARTIDIFAGTVKEETGGEHIVGAFYGYTFESGGTVTYGSHALRRLLSSENLDFFSSPNAYTRNREFGIDWADMIPVDSVKLHGKLAFIECDVRTHLTSAVQDARPGEYPDDIYKTKSGATVWVGPPTKELSREALRKCFAHQLTKGSAVWWFDMWGGWYSDPMLMDELRKMREIASDGNIPRAEPIGSEVAFFGDETSYQNLLNRSPHLTGITISRTSMGNTGAPFDTYLVEDIEKVIGKYKAAVFPFPIPSRGGIRAMEICKREGIPYLSATDTHHTLTYGEIRSFLKACGVHLYTDAPNVIYLGCGYLGLHSGTGGNMTVKLPQALRVSPIFGADVDETVTDTLNFSLPECSTALFKISEQI